MYEVPDPNIDVDLLIKEVKARPCLYEKSHPRYGDPQVRRVAWDEVTAIIYARLWEEYSDEEKAEKMDQILKRWKNLRNCFLRESKRQKDPKWINGCAYKRRKYIYYEAMSFLNSENDTEETTLGIDLPESTGSKNTKVNETPIPDPKAIPKTSAEVCISPSPKNSVKTKLSANSVNANAKLISTNSVKPQVSTNPVIAHVATNPIIAHVATNPIIAQVSTDQQNAQVSNDSVNAQVSTDTSNSVSWPDLVINIPFDSLIPDNPDSVINNPPNSVRTYNVTNFDSNASYNTVIAENVTNFVTNTSVDSASVNNSTNFVTNTSSDYASANDSTNFVTNTSSDYASANDSNNFVTNTSSEYVSASELTNFVANTLSNYASANDAINFLTNTSMNSVNANDSTNFIPNTSSNSVSVENSTNFVNNTSPPINSDANNSSKATNSAADNPGKYVTNISTNATNPVAYTVSNSVMVNVHDSDSTSFALSLVPMLNKLSIDDKVECQIKILSAILPFVRKSREERRRMTAPPARQTRGQRKQDLITLEIKSDDSDDDLFLA